MRATLQILSAIIRTGPDHTVFGSPYDSALTISSVDGSTAVGAGLTKKSVAAIDGARAKAIVKCLNSYGLRLTGVRIKVDQTSGKKTKRVAKVPSRRDPRKPTRKLGLQ